MKAFFLFSMIVSGFLYSSPREEVTNSPIAFSIAREDALQDLAILKCYFPEERISMMMTGSASCTAAKFAAEAPLSSLHSSIPTSLSSNFQNLRSICLRFP